MADDRAVASSPPAALARTYELAARALRAMGRRRYVIADVAGTISYWVQPPAKRRLCAHLHSRAAGGLPAAEASRRARASYRAYARMIVDTVWIHGIPLERVFEHGDIEGVEHLDAAASSGRGGILTLVHLGSWDIAASVALAAGHSVASVMAPVGPDWVTELLAWSRRAKRMELFTPKGAARGLLRVLRGSGIIALLVDIPEGGPTVTVRFCNGPVRFSTGPASLAKLTGAAILPVSCWRIGSRYHVHIHPPDNPGRDEDVQDVMQRVATLLEDRVLRVPEQWYPFNQIYEDEM